MGIGVSDGNYYESEFEMHAAPLETQAGTRNIKGGDYAGDLPMNPGPDRAEPPDVVAKHWQGLYANWRSIADKIDPKAWAEWKKTGPFSTNIEDRREEEPDLNLLMQLPLDELPGVLKRLTEKPPK